MPSWQSGLNKNSETGAMPNVSGGFQPDTKTPSARRADFDLLRRIAELERLVADLTNRVDVLETPTP